MELKQLLERHGIQQRELAVAIDVPEETVSRWVNEKQAPSHSNIVAILQFLNRPETLRRMKRRRAVTFEEILGEKATA